MNNLKFLEDYILVCEIQAQRLEMAFEEVEKIHGHDNWKLYTILQEEGNCYLYEKLGYKRTGLVENINDKMDIVYYEKN